MNQNVLVLMVVVVGLIANILLQHCTQKNPNVLVILLLLITHIIYFILYIKLLKKDDISTIYPSVKIISLIAMVLIGILLFNEDITRNKIYSIVFAILAVYFLSC
jgi:multidrug transporter EmrE-like cation transporter